MNKIDGVVNFQIKNRGRLNQFVYTKNELLKDVNCILKTMAGTINKDFMDLDIKPKKSRVSLYFNTNLLCLSYQN